jgi:hypothetical protein
MRDLTELNSFRDRSQHVFERYGTFGDDKSGAFQIPHPATGVKLTCIAAAGDGWDHVSVSLSNRCPNWVEMEFVKRRFFRDDEVAMQLHVKVKDHINVHPYVLHLWRPHHQPIPVPPKEYV